MVVSSSQPPGDAPAIQRRRWEAVLPREEIAGLLAERRYQDLIGRLTEARARWPRDLELLRSIRVLEDHLRQVTPDAKGEPRQIG
jgi:hypothetical protein